MTGVLSLFAGAVDLVRSRQGDAELWLPAVPAGAPPLSQLSPRLSSDGYSLVHVEVSGVGFGSLAVYTATLLAGFLVLAGGSFFLAYLSGAPFSAVDTFGMEDAMLFFAGVLLGLLSLVFSAAGSLLRDSFALGSGSPGSAAADGDSRN